MFRGEDVIAPRLTPLRIGADFMRVF